MAVALFRLSAVVVAGSKTKYSSIDFPFAAVSSYTNHRAISRQLHLFGGSSTQLSPAVAIAATERCSSMTKSASHSRLTLSAAQYSSSSTPPPPPPPPSPSPLTHHHLPCSASSSDDEKEAYIVDLKLRLDKSWSAGLPALSISSTPENHVSRGEVLELLTGALEILRTEPNVLPLTFDKLTVKDGEIGTISVVGDTHGQYYDVLNLFELHGEPGEHHLYLFNGDFVDRGSFSVQVALLLLAYKVLYPRHFYILRGNHETVDMNLVYGFFHEVIAKYDVQVVKQFWQIFDYLPLAATIENREQGLRALVLHGGLFSDDSITLEYLNTIERHTALQPTSATNSNNEHATVVHDLLWADPQKSNGRAINHSRNGGLLFGPDVTKAFLEKNKLDLLIRSHQVRKHGFSIEHDGKLITLFSAPNYCDSMNNKGAVLRFTSGNAEPKIDTFTAVPHPPIPIMAHMHYYKHSSHL